MKASEMTFGIEIETTMPAGTIAIGGYHRGRQAEGLPSGWQTQSDCSIDTMRGRVGCEFVSPILRGADGIRQVIEVCDKIKAMGGRVNRSTGLHVHVGFDRSNAKGLDRLITLTSNFEKAIYASTGTKSRENGRWSRGVQELGGTLYARNADRYRVLNLTNIMSGRRPAVEFRAFAGTLNSDKIIGHIRMCLGLVERALKAKRITNWAAKTPTASSPIHRSGEGQTALARLYYQLGWTKGRQNHVHGLVGDADAPTITETKRTMMKLARKYDSN